MRNRLLAAVIVFALSLLFGNQANADIINAGFETGDFTGWTTIGDARVVDAGYGTTPKEGNYMALLTTGEGAVPISEVMQFLGIEDSWPSLLPGVTPESKGSAIKTSSMEILVSFEAFVKSLSNGGFPASYGWVLSINEDGRGAASGTGAPTDSLVSSSTVFDYESTDWGRPGSGSDGTSLYTFAFVVIDNGTDFDTTGYGLLVDDLHLTPSSSVPEPASMLFFGTGLAGIVGIRLRKKK